MFYNKKIIVTLFILFFVQFVFAQRDKQQKLQFAIDAGNEQFYAGYFNNATKFYNDAIDLDANNTLVLYQLAECYRILHHYNDSYRLYQKVAVADYQKYPLSLFYIALIDKKRGYYQKAINQFNFFIKETEKIPVSDFENKKAFYQRSLVEIEGSIWAIENPQNQGIVNLQKPLNSPFNDIAAVPLIGDSLLIVTSGRIKNITEIRSDIGDAYSDNYLFVKHNEIWEESKFDGHFEAINSKFNEGPGCFDAQQNSYYYTSCGQENSPFCKIYVIERIDNKWTKPKLLPKVINAENSDNLNPSLSASGDTLFFISNRSGGSGGFDLWYSIKKDEDWHEPINLGQKINTPFDEISPFYYSPKKLLFFASEGHKGLGGKDIFMAENIFSNNIEISNISAPYNSNYDDCYFILGENKGYLTSNRPGTVGQMDIYEFAHLFPKTNIENIKISLASLRNKVENLTYDVPVVAKLEVPTELFFEEEQANYDRILSVWKAGMIYDIKIPLPKPDFDTYNALSIDDKSLIDMLFSVEKMNKEQLNFDSIYTYDSQKWQELPPETQQMVKSIAQKYAELDTIVEYIELDKEQTKFYTALDIKNKEQIDRLIAFQNYKEIQERPVAYEEIFVEETSLTALTETNMVSEEETNNYEKILSFLLAEYIYNIDLRFIESDYKLNNQLTIDDLSLIDMIFLERSFYLNDSTKNVLKQDDKFQYEKLVATEKQQVNEIVEAFFNAPETADFIQLSERNKEFYSGLPVDRKFLIDRLIVYRIHTILYPPASLIEKELASLSIDSSLLDKKEKNAIERILSVKIAGYIFNTDMMLSDIDFEIYQNMSIDIKSIVELIFQMRISEYSQQKIDSIQTACKKQKQELDASENELINKIAENYLQTSRQNRYVILNAEQQEFYKNLTIPEKQKTDKLIALQIFNLLKQKTTAIRNFDDISQNNLAIKELSGAGELIAPIDYEAYEKIISYQIAQFIHKTNFPLIESDYEIYQNFTIDDLSIVDLLFTSKKVDYQESMVLEAVKKSDQMAYHRLKSDEKAFIDQLVQVFMKFSHEEDYIKIPDKWADKYKKLSINEKYKIDRLVASRIDILTSPLQVPAPIQEYAVTDDLSLKDVAEFSDLLTIEEYYNYEKVLAYQLAAFIHQEELPFLLPDYENYQKFTFEDFSLIDMMFQLKTWGLDNDEVIKKVQEADEKEYQKTTTEKRQFVDKVVNAILNTENYTEKEYIELNNELSETYKKLTVEEKYKTDRLILSQIRLYNAVYSPKEIEKQIQNDAISDNILELTEVSTLIDKDDYVSYEKVLSFQIANFLFETNVPYFQSDYLINEQLNIDDKSLLEMMFLLRTEELQKQGVAETLRKSIQEEYNKLDPVKKAFIDRVSQVCLNTDSETAFILLAPDDAKYYKKLSINEKFKIDRYILSKVSPLVKKQKEVQTIEENLQTDEISEGFDEMATIGLVDKQDKIKYEKVLSFMIANFVYQSDFPFIETDYEIHQAMTIDDKSMIDMLYLMRISGLDDKDVQQKLQEADYERYQNLSLENRNKIDAIVIAYENIPENIDFVTLEQTTKKYYANLTIDEKFETDRLLVMKMSDIKFENEVKEKVEETLTTDELGITTQENPLMNEDLISAYEKIISMKTAAFIFGVEPQFIASDYRTMQNLSIDDLSLIDMMYELRIAELQDPQIITTYKRTLKKQYEKLSPNKKQFINRITIDYKKAKNSTYISLNNEDSARYAQLSIEQKYKTDRLILSQMFGLETIPEEEKAKLLITEDLHLEELQYDEAIVSPNDYQAYERILAYRIATFIYDVPELQFIQPDYELYKKQTIDDLSLIDMLYRLRTMGVSTQQRQSLKHEDSLIYQSLTTTQKLFIERITKEYKHLPNSDLIKLSLGDADYYKNLSLLEKYKLDRLIIRSIVQNTLSLNQRPATQTTEEKTRQKLISFTIQADCSHPDIKGKLINPNGTVTTAALVLKNQNGLPVANSEYENGYFKFAGIKSKQEYNIFTENPNTNLTISNLQYICHESETSFQNPQIVRDTIWREKIITSKPDTVFVEKIITNNTPDTVYIEKVNEKLLAAVGSNIYFDYNSSTLTSQTKIALDQIALQYQQQKGKKIHILAYTDDLGSSNYNLALSKKRGKAVYHYLVVEQGIDPNLIELNAKGENSELPNQDNRSRQVNRRVTIFIK